MTNSRTATFFQPLLLALLLMVSALSAPPVAAHQIGFGAGRLSRFRGHGSHRCAHKQQKDHISDVRARADAGQGHCGWRVIHACDARGAMHDLFVQKRIHALAATRLTHVLNSRGSSCVRF
jgi:hypothetical protein